MLFVLKHHTVNLTARLKKIFLFTARKIKMLYKHKITLQSFSEKSFCHTFVIPIFDHKLCHVNWYSTISNVIEYH